MPLSRVEWAKQFYDDAAAASAESGIFPLTLLTQAIIESQRSINGTYYPAQSQLAKQYNNYFGIKGQGTAGSIVLTTQEYINGQYVTVNATFARYQDIYDSFRSYVNFLRDNPRYTNAGVFSAQNYQEQLQRIASAGYATNPNYAALLVNIANNLIDNLTEEIKEFASDPSSSLILPLLMGSSAIYFLTRKKNAAKN